MGGSMFQTAIELFLGEPLVNMVQDNPDRIEFITFTGTVGNMEINFNGNWDIWVGEEVVYEVEQELFPLLTHTNDYQLIDLYEYARNIDRDSLKYKSKKFLKIVRDSIENILLNSKLPLEGRTVIDCMEVIYTNNRKFLISLN